MNLFLWAVMEVRQRLWSSLAAHYESVELELLRDWEPLDSSRASPFGERKESSFSVSNGNENAY
jgi:hypothetical protein